MKEYNNHFDLRDNLLSTTDKRYCESAMEYFRQYLDDPELLRRLVKIALQGSSEDRVDFGDCPWAAANVIVEFPAELLLSHRDSIDILANDEWSYLSNPAKQALSKIDTYLEKS